jgi:TerC family integral membrane protein
VSPVESIGSPALWIGFSTVILLLLALDLGVFHRHAHEVRFKEALAWTAVWVTLAMLFNLFIYFEYGGRKALEFLTGYLIEEALSVDNVFVFLVTFAYFRVPANLQHRVLFWGILGALVMRLAFILAGVTLLERFHWLIFVFGGLLIVTGSRLLTHKPDDVHPERNPVVKLFQRVVPAVGTYRGPKFFVREGGRLVATPLALVLVAIEATDLVFALDSIPAVLAVTRDPLIVYTSNVFAILGLRSLFFVLSGVLGRFEKLNVGLALVLIFVGAKMIIADWYHIHIGVSLGVVASLIGGSVVWSMLLTRGRPPGAGGPSLHMTAGDESAEQAKRALP